jgi:hypothetical protein
MCFVLLFLERRLCVDRFDSIDLLIVNMIYRAIQIALHTRLHPENRYCCLFSGELMDLRVSSTTTTLGFLMIWFFEVRCEKFQRESSIKCSFISL